MNNKNGGQVYFLGMTSRINFGVRTTLLTGVIHKKVGQLLKLKAPAYSEATAGRESSRLKER
jgi:hypothetical protein